MKVEIRNFGLLVAVCLSLAGCASMGTPGGGPRDVTPPVYMKSEPTPGQLNFNKKKMAIYFDEMIVVQKPSEKVVISPPQRVNPIIKSVANRVMIEMIDSLIPNTTYTLDFSDAIADLNENNRLPGFALAFSTGNMIDTMNVSGTLIRAENLELVPNMLVGIQRDTNTVSFKNDPLLRISKTDEKGRFSVRNMAPGKYRLFALNDLNRDYMFDQAGEEIAFYDSIVIPSTTLAFRQDTIWQDSITIDTIKEVQYTRFLPDDMILRLFKEDFEKQYLVKNARPKRNLLSFVFNAKSDSLPVLHLLNNSEIKNWYTIEHSQHRDTVNFWITNKKIANTDTLAFAISYLKTDSLLQLAPQSDTLKLIDIPRPKDEPKKQKGGIGGLFKKDDEHSKVQVDHLKFAEAVPSLLDVYEPIAFEFDEPLEKFDRQGFKLRIIKDTIKKEIPFDLVRDSIRIRRYSIYHQWQPGAEYSIEIDSAACQGLNGLTNDYYERPFKVKSLDAYSKITFFVNGVKDHSFIELLNGNDEVVRRAQVEHDEAVFEFLTPSSYYARLIVDKNNNGKWDAGEYGALRQPEDVFYYQKKLTLRMNFDYEEDWDVEAIPLLLQKPEALRKVKRVDKPKTDKKNPNQKEEEDDYDREIQGALRNDY